MDVAFGGYDAVHANTAGVSGYVKKADLAAWYEYIYTNRNQTEGGTRLYTAIKRALSIRSELQLRSM
jgi:hypothetical protein